MKLYCIGSAGGYPMAQNGTTSYILTSSDESFHLLIDAGSGSALAIEQYLPTNQLDAIWISHDHPDHTADLGIFQHLFLLKEPAPQKGQVPIYLNKDSVLWPNLIEGPSSKGVAYDINKPLEIGPFSARFLKTTHPVECAAIRIVEVATGKVFVFTADSGWQESLVDFAKGADLLLSNANFPKAKGQNAIHLTSEEAARLANLAHVKQLVITHIPPQSDDRLIIHEVKEMLNSDIKVSQATPRHMWEF